MSMSCTHMRSSETIAASAASAAIELQRTMHVNFGTMGFRLKAQGSDLSLPKRRTIDRTLQVKGGKTRHGRRNRMEGDSGCHDQGARDDIDMKPRMEISMNM